MLALLVSSIAVTSPSLSAQTGDGGQANCGDPTYSASYFCQAAGTDTLSQSGRRAQSPIQTGLTDSGSRQRDTDSQQVYVDQAGSNSRRQTGSRSDLLFPTDPITDFQKLTGSATGEMPSVFGRDLFQKAPSTFAPANQIPVTNNYIVGPGDEVLLRLWGPESFNSQLTVDTGGSIYIPKVDAIHVAGMRADQLQDQISAEVNHTYRNYRISVSLGQLRSIQVYVVGEARRGGQALLLSAH